MTNPNVQYDLDTSGGLMEEIQELIAAPVLVEDSSKKKRERRYRRPGRAVNHDFCDSCKEGGDLICCDKCPAAFHLLCYNPPLTEEDLPSGDWLCLNCVSAQLAIGIKVESGQPTPPLENVASTSSDGLVTPSQEIPLPEDPKCPLTKVLNVTTDSNPKQYQMPTKFAYNILLPGMSKKPLRPKETTKTKKNSHEDTTLAQLAEKLCNRCKRSCRHAPLVQCDYCPLLFHCDCLDPPLTFIPTSRWMCPNHVEHIIDKKVLTSLSLTERLEHYEKYSGFVDQHAIKLAFLNKVNRAHPPFRRKVKLPARKTMSIPGSVVQQYNSPPSLLPRIRDSIPSVLITNNRSEKKELTEYLRNLVQFQKEIIEFESEKIDTAVENLNTFHDNMVSKPIMQNLRHSAEFVAVEENLVSTARTKTEDNGSVYTPYNVGAFKNQFTTTPSKYSPSLAPSYLDTSEHSTNPSTWNYGLSHDKMSAYNPEVTIESETPENTTEHVHMNKKDFELADVKKMDKKLVELCAQKYIELAFPTLKENREVRPSVGMEARSLVRMEVRPSVRMEARPSVKNKPARALLVPLDIICEPVLMTCKTMNLGLGVDKELSFSDFGHCKNVSEKHATIFFDELSGQYELINYSMYGTVVDNKIFCHDLSTKNPSTSSSSSTSGRRNRRNASRTKKSKIPLPEPILPPTVKHLPPLPCSCKYTHAELSQSPTGNEGSALLYHGSLIQCGCLNFVFSIVEYGHRLNQMSMAVSASAAHSASSSRSWRN